MYRNTKLSKTANNSFRKKVTGLFVEATDNNSNYNTNNKDNNLLITAQHNITYRQKHKKIYYVA